MPFSSLQVYLWQNALIFICVQVSFTSHSKCFWFIWRLGGLSLWNYACSPHVCTVEVTVFVFELTSAWVPRSQRFMAQMLVFLPSENTFLRFDSDSNIACILSCWLSAGFSSALRSSVIWSVIEDEWVWCSTATRCFLRKNNASNWKCLPNLHQSP